MRKSLLTLTILALLVSFAALGAPTPAHATVSLTESFRNATAPGWTLLGDARLTGDGTIDPPGNGWLRLTSNITYTAGTALFDTPFSSDDGVDIQFEYATYGGDGADGFTFYLIDGTTPTPTIGAPGGSLGYSWRLVDPVGPGVTNGYVGIGFDEFGNFSNTDYGDCTPSCPGFLPDSVAIRGSGSLNSGFNFLTRASTPISTGSRAGAKPVHITIVDQKITVAISGTTQIDQFDLKSAPGQQTTPRTFKMGFSASTGALTNYHEVRSLTVTSIKNSSTTAIQSSANPSTTGQSVTFTATVRDALTTAALTSGTVTFLDGTTPIGTGTLNAAGQATFSTAALAAGAHPITARFEGTANHGISSAALTQQVNVPPVYTDLAVAMTHTLSYARNITFTISVVNNGPSAVGGALLSDPLPAPMSGTIWRWTCVGASGAVCPAASGTGSLSQTLSSLPIGGRLTYTVHGLMAVWSYWSNTVTITAPVGVIDSNTGNNSRTLGRYQLLLPIIANNSPYP